MYCSSLTRDPPAIQLAIVNTVSSAALCIDQQECTRLQCCTSHSCYVLAKCQAHDQCYCVNAQLKQQQLLALLLPVTILDVSVAREPVYGCLEGGVWFADDTPQLLNRAIQRLVKEGNC